MQRIVWMVYMGMFLGMFLIQGNAAAFNPVDLNKLLATKSCTHCDLSGAKLFGANLGNANLDGANLHEANLRGANLGGTNLFGANLSGATWTDGSKCKEGSVGECKR